jgi:ATP-dependent protease ClpP protease subunit
MSAERLAKLRAKLSDRHDGWFRILNQTDESAEIYVYDEIGGWGVQAGQFAAALRDLDVSSLKVRINSPGGDYFDGVAIYNLLKEYKATVSVVVDGLAASAASIVAMAGDTVAMGKGSQMMIHDAMIATIGNAADLREMADQLDVTSQDIAQLYADRAGGTVTEWRDQMRAETWYSAEDAVAAGLADEVVNKCGDKDKSNATAVLPQLNLAAVIKEAAREPEPIITAELFRAAVDLARLNAPASTHKPPAPTREDTGLDLVNLAQLCVEGATK